MKQNTTITLSIICGLGLYAIWLASSNIQAVFHDFEKVEPKVILILCLLSFFNYGVRFVRWQYLLKVMGHQLPLIKSALYYFSGYALTATPGKLGEAVRGVYLKKRGVNHTETFAAVGAERLSDIWAMILIALLGLASFSDQQTMIMTLIGFFAVVTLMIRKNIITRVLTSLKKSLNPGKLTTILQHTQDLWHNISKLLGFKCFLWGILLGLIGWGAEAFAFAYLVKSMGFTAPMTLLASIFAISMLAGAISLLPGGIGSAEAVMVMLLLTLHMGYAEATVATIIIRLVTLWLAVFLGVGVMAYLQATESKKL